MTMCRSREDRQPWGCPESSPAPAAATESPSASGEAHFSLPPEAHGAPTHVRASPNTGTPTRHFRPTPKLLPTR